jgi:membrane-bound serine protease (ClpP class)
MTLSMTPDQAILLLTLGVALIYVELNRPGWILPGALGLLAVLLAGASLLRSGIDPVAASLCASATAILVCSARKTFPVVALVAATLSLMLGLLRLTPQVHMAVALPCGLLLGTGTSLLTRIARRARTNKGLD